MEGRYQASTNTKQVAALMVLGVELLSPEILGGGLPVSRFFTEVFPYNPREPDGGGELQWLLSERGISVGTGDLREAWENHEAALDELDAFIESLDEDIKAILKRLIPRAMMATSREAMYNWTHLATAAKKATKLVAFRHGKGCVTLPFDYSKGEAEKFGLPYPNPALKQKR